MDDGLMLIIGDDGIARAYDDTYDIVIHCESAEEQDKVRKMLPLVNLVKLDGVTKIEPEPTRGRWIRYDDYFGESEYWECSVCRNAFTLIDGTPELNNYHFCPNCGADMRGEQNEDDRR